MQQKNYVAAQRSAVERPLPFHDHAGHHHAGGARHGARPSDAEIARWLAKGDDDPDDDPGRGVIADCA